MKVTFFLLFLVTLIISCMPKTLHVTPSDELDANERIIRLTKGPCFGSCPVFDLDIYANGRVVFMPRMFTLMEDTVTSNWPLEPILSAFSQAGLDSMSSEYLQPISDIPTYSLTFQKKRIRWNGLAPRILYNLMGVLDSLVIDEGWLEPSEKVAQDEATIELIVRLTQAGDDSSWLELYRDYKLSIARKVDTTGEYLILQYDEDSISANELIRLLRKDTHVKSASRSRVAQFRN